jgi:hypothetical protein
MLGHVGNADRGAAEARGLTVGNLRWQLEVFRPHGLLVQITSGCMPASSAA